jgi:hypothetical protein
MIAISPLRTRRLDVLLRELSIGDEIALCHLPEGAHEKAITEFLARAVESASAPSERHVTNPRAWSVGERLLGLAHYCAHTRDDKPDYAVTESSKLSDYLDIGMDAPATPSKFELHGDRWVLAPLTGAALEALEAMQAESPDSGREHWIVGAMAAQLLREGEETPDPVAYFSDYMDWLRSRMETMRALPSSAFELMYARYYAATQSDTQFFRIWFDEQGVIVLPKEAGAATPPARFLVLSSLGTVALSLAGKA